MTGRAPPGRLSAVTPPPGSSEAALRTLLPVTAAVPEPGGRLPAQQPLQRERTFAVSRDPADQQRQRTGLEELLGGGTVVQRPLGVDLKARQEADHPAHGSHDQ